MFGWGDTAEVRLARENQELRARIQSLESTKHNSKFLDIDCAPVILFGIDGDLVVNLWNKEASRITLLSADDIVGKKIDNFVSEQQSQTLQRFIESLKTGQLAPQDYLELTVFGKGSTQTLLLSVAARCDPVGCFLDVIFAGHELGFKRKSLDHSKINSGGNELQAFIELANAAIFGVDVDGRVNEWNRHVAEITGIPKEEAMGSLFVESFIEPEFRESVGLMLQSALNGQATTSFEFPFFARPAVGDSGGASISNDDAAVAKKASKDHAGRRRVDVLLNATARKDPEGRLVGVLGVGQACLPQEAPYLLLLLILFEIF
jgi:PAS domain-containing protein